MMPAAASVPTLIRILHPDWSDAQIDAEVQALRDEWQQWRDSDAA